MNNNKKRSISLFFFARYSSYIYTHTNNVQHKHIIFLF